MGTCGGCGPECNGPCSTKREAKKVEEVVNEMQDNAHGMPSAEEVLEYIRNYRAMQRCNCENCKSYA